MTEKKISNEAVRSEIGKRLRAERERLGLKQEDYFRLGEWSARTVSNWEAGRTNPTADFFADVEVLGLDVNYIITGRRAAAPLTGPAAAPVGDSDTIRIPLFSATGSMGNGNDLIT